MSVTKAGKQRIRAPAKDWKFIVKTVADVLTDLRNKKIPVNLRQMFYNLVVKEIIGNTKSDYIGLSVQTGHARMNGEIPLDCFIDGVRQTFDNGYKDDSDFQNIEDYIENFIAWLDDTPEDFVKELPTWYKQKHYVEIWIEKAAQYTTFKIYLRGRQVRITVCRGNASLGSLVPNVRRFRRIARSEPDKQIHLQYYGDMDPSGDFMDGDIVKRITEINAVINIQEFIEYNGVSYYASLIADDDQLELLRQRLEKCKAEKLRNELLNEQRLRQSEILADHFPDKFPNLKIDFERIAITEEQIEQYNLPELPPDKQTQDKLDRDTKTEGFIEKHGRLIAVELDALSAKYPDELEKLIQSNIDKYYDPDIYKTEILEPYGSKEYKAEIKQMVLQRLKDFIQELETETDDCEDTN